MIRVNGTFLLVLALLQGCKEAFDADRATHYFSSTLPVDATAEPPQIRVGIGIETGDFALSWGSVPGATGYELEESSIGLGVRVHWMGGEQHYFVGQVPAGRSYIFRVRGVGAHTVTRWSEPVTVP